MDPRIAGTSATSGIPEERILPKPSNQDLRYRKEMRIAAVVSGIFVALVILHLYGAYASSKAHPNGDFFGIWSYARLIRRHPISDLYNATRLHSLQIDLGMDPNAVAPFPYPPSFLFLIWPIGYASYQLAYAEWAAATFLFYVIMVCAGRPVASTLLLLAAPTTAITLTSGQSGFLLAGLLVGGLRLTQNKPVMAGILFGLLTYKPQFGLMVPVALIAGSHWRCMTSAVLTTISLAAIATLAFGADVWPVFLHSAQAYAKWFDAGGTGLRFRSTVTADLQALGASAIFVSISQVVVLAIAASAVWLARRWLPAERALCVTIVATCLAVPHAFIYDLPMLTVAALYYLLGKHETRASISLLEGVLLILVLVFPGVALFVRIHLPLTTLILPSFLILLLADRGHLLLSHASVPSLGNADRSTGGVVA